MSKEKRKQNTDIIYLAKREVRQLFKECRDTIRNTELPLEEREVAGRLLIQIATAGSQEVQMDAI
jgi:hypothetical protein